MKHHQRLKKTLISLLNLFSEYQHQNFQSSTGCRTKSQLSKSCTALQNYKDGIEITSTDDNKIRIQIKYDDNVPDYTYPFTNVTSNNCYDDRGRNRISTNFNEHYRFNEKAIDVPEDFERNAQLRFKEQSKTHLRKKVATSVRHLNPLEEFLQVSLK